MWNVVAKHSLLLGMSVDTEQEAKKWAREYARKYRAEFVVVQTDLKQTCPLPTDK